MRAKGKYKFADWLKHAYHKQEAKQPLNESFNRRNA